MFRLIEIILLLAANGFFVAAEFALVKARGFRIEKLAGEGIRSAQLTLRIHGNLEAYLAACQLGITMASLGLGWVGEPAVAALLEPFFRAVGIPETVLHGVAFATGFILFSSLHIVVGEQVPKTLAIRKAEPVALWVAYPLQISYLLVWPLNALLNRASRAILSLFNVEEATHADVLTDEELKGLVETSKQHGELEQQKADMLRNLFEFDQRIVGRIMIPRASLHILDISASPDRNAAIIQDSGHSRFPVVDGSPDNIVGLVLAKELYTAMLAGEHEPWRDLARYCRQPLVVPERQLVSNLFEIMQTRRVHMAFVVDEYGALTGIVTLEDLLEEIVGEIHDETDSEEASASIAEFDRYWEAEGLVSLTDFQRLTGLTLPDNLDVNTLSGLFMQRLGRMPEVGDALIEGDFRLRAVSITNRRVGRIRIEHIPRDPKPTTGPDESVTSDTAEDAGTHDQSGPKSL